MRDLSEMGDFAAEAVKHDTVSFVVWQRDGSILTANPQFFKLTGYRPGDLERLRWPESFAVKGSRARILSEMDTQDLGMDIRRLEETLIRADGTTIPIGLYVHRYRQSKSSVPIYFAFLDDITERKKIEDRLRLTEFAIDRFKDPSLWVDSKGRIIYVNQQAGEMLSYSREELLSMYIWNIDPNYPLEKYRKLWEEIRAAGSSKFESCIVAKGGFTITVEVQVSYIHFRDQEFLLAFTRDVTERKRFIESLADSEAMFRVLSETALAAVLMSRNNRFVYANPMALEITGYSYDEFMRMPYWELIHPDYREEIKRYGDLLLAGKALTGRFEMKLLRKDGKERWCDVSVGPVMYKGTMSGVITAVDITERKNAELALRDSEEKFRVMSELSPVAIFMYQGDMMIYANPSAVGFTGFSYEEIVHKKFWDMVHPKYREMVKQYGLERQRGLPVPIQYEIQYVTKDGEPRWAQFTSGQIEYRGKPAGIVTAIDMTDRKRNEIALNEARLQAELYVDLMGHDINNMNQAALGFLELAQGRIESGEPLSGGDLQLISGAVESLKSSSGLIDTVRKLQKEKKGIYSPQEIEVDRILDGIRSRFSRVPGRNVTVGMSVKSHCRVRANELLRDVFGNIVGNAIKHSTGDITINASTREVVENGVRFCRVEIEDTGPGISDDRKKAIFDRSTPQRGKLTGKGLGLYLVRTLVDDYHGKIWVEDRVPGDYTKGCKFVILLPISSKVPGEADGQARA